MSSVLDPSKRKEDDLELRIRPQNLDEYVGQTDLKENLSVYMKAASDRGEVLDHTLLYGPPGLGKTTLAHIIAREMNSNIVTTSGPTLEKPVDMLAIISSIKEGDILFIDEIHRLPKVVEEVLYPAMEDFKVDIMIGEGSRLRPVTVNVPKFTLIGATTRVGDLSSPLRDRFGIVSKMNYYTDDELSLIVKRSSKFLEVKIDDEAAFEIAIRSRGTPRIANRLLKRSRDFAHVKNDGLLDLETSKYALDRLDIDEYGLDEVDRNYLLCIIDRFDGGPAGLNAIASTITEDVQTIEDVYEPYLLKEGFINRTNKGRVATEKAYKHLKKD